MGALFLFAFQTKMAQSDPLWSSDRHQRRRNQGQLPWPGRLSQWRESKDKVCPASHPDQTLAVQTLQRAAQGSGFPGHAQGTRAVREGLPTAFGDRYMGPGLGCMVAASLIRKPG